MSPPLPFCTWQSRCWNVTMFPQNNLTLIYWANGPQSGSQSGSPAAARKIQAVKPFGQKWSVSCKRKALNTATAQIRHQWTRALGQKKKPQNDGGGGKKLFKAKPQRAFPYSVAQPLTSSPLNRKHTMKPSPKTARLCLKTSSYRPVIYHTGSHFGLCSASKQHRCL